MAFAVPARAQSAADLEVAGEDAAKRGSYAEAIDKFKAADRLEPRARHACLIALAYTRRNLWPQAEIFRDRCHKLATERREPLPEWIGVADRQIEDQIARAIADGSVAEVTIAIEPADAASAAVIAVSSFAPDETFGPRAIHLPRGIHQVFATAPGYRAGGERIDVADGKPQHVSIELRSAKRSKTPWIVAGAGLGVAAIGGVLDATWYASRRSDYAHHFSDPAYESRWETARDVVIGFYVAGAITAGIGLVLAYTGSAEAGPAISVAPTSGGAMVTVGWQR
jgi:hypothetical protein